MLPPYPIYGAVVRDSERLEGKGMPSVIDIVIGLFLSYYWTGIDMVTFHSQLDPVDRPGYVYESRIRRFLVGAVWPYVAKLNREFGWHFVFFASGVFVFTLLHAFLYPYFKSSGLVVLVISVVRVIPVISNVITGPCALFAMLLWLVLAKPFGAKPPSGIERMQR